MKQKIDISMLPNGVMLWTREEVEKALQVKTTTVYELIKRGKLRIVKIGRCTRFLPSDVEKLIRDSIY